MVSCFFEIPTFLSLLIFFFFLPPQQDSYIILKTFTPAQVEVHSGIFRGLFNKTSKDS